MGETRLSHPMKIMTMVRHGLQRVIVIREEYQHEAEVVDTESGPYF